MEIANLVIELTRRCNMFCNHCLRGDIENRDIDSVYIDSLLDQVTNISELTLTGGEPSLNVPMIEYILSELKRRNISLGGFYIATNGLVMKEEFVLICLKLYSYSDDKEMCRVDVSNDYYHQCEGSYNTELLDGLTFVSRKYNEEGWNYNNDMSLINQGRSEYGVELKVRKVETKEEFNSDVVYLNCKGDVVLCCDLSYENQDKHVVCGVGGLKEYYNNLED